MTIQAGTNQEANQSAANQGNLELTEEIVQKIAERVYRMILEDLKLEYERGRGYMNENFHRGLS